MSHLCAKPPSKMKGNVEHLSELVAKWNSGLQSSAVSIQTQPYTLFSIAVSISQERSSQNVSLLLGWIFF